MFEFPMKFFSNSTLVLQKHQLLLIFTFYCCVCLFVVGGKKLRDCITDERILKWAGALFLVQYLFSRGKSGLQEQLYIPKFYCAWAHDQGVQWWPQSDDMIVEYLLNAENEKSIRHDTLSWHHQSMKKGQFLHICKSFSPIHFYFTF